MERFEVIKQYPMYSVSTTGRIMKNSSRKIMKPSKKQNGYMQINLFTSDGRRKKELVHRLVALTFIPNKEGLPEVNHIDGVRDNNALSNLEWVTRKENVNKSAATKKIRVKKQSFEIVGEYDSIQLACKALGLTDSNISACLHNKNQKTHKGYVFEFIE